MLTCEDELRAIREQHGYGEFDRCVKKMMRERLQNPGREKRKPIPESIKRKLYVKQDGRCAECNERFDYKNLEGDHRDPNRQDFNNPKQWQLLCKPCNLEKGAKSVMEQTKFYSRTAKEILNPQDDI